MTELTTRTLVCAAALAALCVGAPTQALGASKVLTVDINDPDAAAPGDNLYAEIQDAIDAASPGDTIRVHAGTYAPITVRTDDLTIVPANASSRPVVRTSPVVFSFPFLQPGVAVLIRADGVTVRGMTVLAPPQTPPFGIFATQGFSASGDDITLTDNTVFDHHWGYLLEVTNSTIQRNVASQSISSVGAMFPPTIGFRIAFGGNPAGNRYLDNHAQGVWDVGFRIEDVTDCAFIGNEATGNESAGFDVFGCRRLTFTHNVASETGYSSGSGFVLRNVRDSTFHATVSDDSAANGVALVGGSTGNTFSGTKVRDNGAWGVFVNASATGNAFVGTTGSGNVLGLSND